VLAALERIGWHVKRQSGSHRFLVREGWPDYEFAFHDGEELGRRILTRMAGLESGRVHGKASSTSARKTMAEAVM
jgi:predicted RNA binding protein YcfA (HicA-like mRNA interferase family)